MPDASGRASLSFALVNGPALIGLQISAQAFQWYAFNPYGLDYSNGVRLTFGL